MEKECRRSLVAFDGLKWKPGDDSEAVDVCVKTDYWIPRSVKSQQSWNPELQALTHTMDTEDLYDLFVCHQCKSDPTIVTTFDFTFRGWSAAEAEAGLAVQPQDCRFTALMEMLYKNSQHREKIFETHVDLKMDDATVQELNKDHRMLHDVTKEIITNDLDLHAFGLHLGLTYNQITKIRTNNPHSIEGAALCLACEWWGSRSESKQQKVKVILDYVKVNFNQTLSRKIEEILAAN